MASVAKTWIWTGGSQGIGAGIARAFLERNYNVVATSRNITRSKELPPSPKLALVDGDIGQASTAARVAETAIGTFGSIDALVNNAGIFLVKPFIDYTAEDVERLVSTILACCIHLTQFAIRQMLAQKSGGSIVSISAWLTGNPVAGLNTSVSMMTKGGMEAMTRNLALEYARDHIRVNVVAPGAVDTPLNVSRPAEFLKGLSPMGGISSVQDIVAAVIYLTEAS